MPLEFREKIADKNLDRTLPALCVSFFGSLLSLIIIYFSDGGRNAENRYHFIFLSLTAIIVAICAILYFILRRTRPRHFYVKEIPLYVSATVGMINCLAIFYNQSAGNPAMAFTETMVFLQLCIIITIAFTFHPVYFSIIIVIAFHFLYPLVLQEFHSNGILCTASVIASLVLISIYKWINTKRLYIREENVQSFKEALQSEVERQTEELMNQHRKLACIQDNTIMGLSNLVENRDSDTGGHVRRTSSLVKALASKTLEDGFYSGILTEDYVKYLEKAAPMHDIGKIVVPDNILKKPGRYTPEEFREMQKHTVDGERIVNDVLGLTEDEQYVQIVKEIVTCHHEKWNGEGYPKGLKCNEIPLSARIMAVADVFDALVSPRCYKDPYTVSEAFEMIQAESGTHFDPIMVAEFKRIKDDVINIMGDYED